MKLTVFQADKGDCLLLTAADGTHMLIDGGMASSYREHVAEALAELRDAGDELEVVYVSHIDQDHISGVLQLMDDLVAWRVHDYQASIGNDSFREPKRPRPPEVRNVWHNAFREQIGKNAGRIENLLAATASTLEAANSSALRAEALRQRTLATSIPEAIELSRRASPEQLNIPLNAHFGGKLAFAREDQQPLQLGSLTITPIGPFQRDLRALRRQWNTWLRDNEKQHEKLRRAMQRDADLLGTSDVQSLLGLFDLAAEELGNRKEVTVPNLASLMLLVEEGARTILLTGDGHHEDILRGLKQTGRLDADGNLHVDVLKVQHHGSEHNLNAAFARRVTADTYIFCANGEHENPDARIVKAIVDSRLGPPGARTKNQAADKPFALLFNSSTKAAPEGLPRAQMAKIEQLVTYAATANSGLISFKFLKGSSFSLELA